MENALTSHTGAPLQLSLLSAPTDEFIVVSPAIIRLKADARAVAAQPSTVMLLGETGSGKEMMARFVHGASPRAGKAFIPVDCSTLSESLFESQLFGHVKGSFTGAVCNTLGFLRAANGGTLFLDEIGELPLTLQAKFLRVLQERCCVPVGDTRPVALDIRLICATNRNLRHMVTDGLFRQDLYFRINVIALKVPPLRERCDDILPLASFFLSRHAELAGKPCKLLSEHAAEALVRYQWPGNIRELFNALEHAYVLSSGDRIELTDLPAPLDNFQFLGRPAANDLNLKNVERRTILEALRRTHYNRAAACRILGIEKRRLNRRIALLKIPLKSALDDVGPE